MKQILLKWFAATGIATGLLFGGALISQTSAQSPQPQVQPAQPEPENLPPQNKRDKKLKPAHKKQPDLQIKAILINQTSTLTKLDQKEVIKQLRGNASLTEIASANGSSEQAVIDAALKQLTERLDQAAANGRVTPERKTEALDKARAEAPRLMNEKGLKNGRGNNKPKQKDGRHELVQATAEVTGLTPEQIRAELASGKSLAQIAQSKGKTADDVLANLKAKADKRVTELLEQAREQLNVVPKQR